MTLVTKPLLDINNSGDTWTCTRCLMAFNKTRPPYCNRGKTTCSVPGCSVQFGFTTEKANQPTRVWLVPLVQS